MKAGGETGIFGKSIAGLLFGAVRTALCRSTHIALKTCKAMCGPSIGMGNAYTLQRQRLDWREEREERRHHVDTDPDRNRTR